MKRDGKEIMSESDQAEIEVRKRIKLAVADAERQVKIEVTDRYKAIMLMMKKQHADIVEDRYLYGELQEKRGKLLAIEKMQSVLKREKDKVEEEIEEANCARADHKVSTIDWDKIDCSFMN